MTTRKSLISAALFLCLIASAAATPSVAPLESLLEAERYEEFFKEAQSLAQQGNADAQFLLGRAYHLGKGVAVDLAKAGEYYNLAAAQRHARAEHNLGSIALDSLDHPNLALEHFSRARSLGLEFPTLYNMGRAYKLRCIRHESKESCTSAGEAYAAAWRGDQKPDSLDEAVRAYVSACFIERRELQTPSVGTPDQASVALAACTQATHWAEKGAAAGLARSTYNRGAIEFDAKHYEKAAPWFRLADERGLGLAAFVLGEMHQQGLGVTRDEAEATKWFKRSAALKHEEGTERVRTILLRDMTATHEPARIHEAIAEWSALEPATGPPQVALDRLHLIDVVKENAVRFPLLAKAPRASFQTRFCPGRDQEMGWNTLWLEWNTLWRIFSVAKPEDAIDSASSLKLLASGRADKQGCITLATEAKHNLREALVRGETPMLNWPGQRYLLSLDRMPNGQLELKMQLLVTYGY